MTACDGVTPALMFNNGDPWLEFLAGQNMLFIIVGHHTGDFAGMTSETELCIGKNKTIHHYPFTCYSNRRLIIYKDDVITWGAINWQWSFAQFIVKSANNLVRINFFSGLMKHRSPPILLCSSYACDVTELIPNHCFGRYAEI